MDVSVIGLGAGLEGECGQLMQHIGLEDLLLEEEVEKGVAHPVDRDQKGQVLDPGELYPL